MVLVLWTFKVKKVVLQRFFTNFQHFSKEMWRQQFEKIFINKLYLFTRIISQAFRKYIVLSGSCKCIKSYLANRWFEHITLLKLFFYYLRVHCVKSVGIWSSSGPHFPAFSRIRTEYGKIRSISPHSVRMWENAGKMRIKITLNMDTFYAVVTMASNVNP